MKAVPPCTIKWLLTLIVSASARESLVPRRSSYEVYSPTVVRSTVVDGDHAALHYNHCAAVARFKDRWICLWNANHSPIESRPGQRIAMSIGTSSPVGGISWSPPEWAFDNPARSVNPVVCGSDVQWQPNLIVIGDELWAFWSQLSRHKKGNYGCWFSILRRPEGRWRNRRLLWDGDPDPMVAGKRRRVLPLSAPVRLASGRVLVPVTLLGPKAADAPPGLKGWAALEKRDSVLWSDDVGKTWHVSPGAIQPGRSWAQWEPTVWEPVPDHPTMFARNNAPAPPDQALLVSKSRDGGATWTPHTPVPIPTASSRMHVVHLKSGRSIMAHNDWPGDASAGRRYNLALFFTRGIGIDFTAGSAFSGDDPTAAYPCIALDGDEALIAYSFGYPPRGIRTAHIHPLPDANHWYLFPRANLPPPPAPKLSSGCCRFAGGQYLTARTTGGLGPRGFTFCAWVIGARGVLIDTRRDRPARGFVIALKHDHPAISMPMPEHELMSRLPLRWHEWNYLGVSVDISRGKVVFRVNDDQEVRPFTPTPDAARILAVDSVRIGAKHLQHSVLPGLHGALRALALFPDILKPDRQHAWADRFAASVGRPRHSPDSATLPRPILAFDAADPATFATTFSSPPDNRRFPVYRMEDGVRMLRLPPSTSAGVDLDANRREDGDEITLRFRFRVLGEGDCTVCTIGDAVTPARLRVRNRRLTLACGEQHVLLGAVRVREWTQVTVRSGGRSTATHLEHAKEVRLEHAPQFTVIYLGEGYPTLDRSAGKTDDKASSPDLDIDVGSVTTRVRHP